MSNSQSSNSYSRWDAGRFLKTLGYFGEIPFLGSFRWLQQLAGQNKGMPGMAVTAIRQKVAILGSDAMSPAFLAALDNRLAPNIDLVTVRLDTPFSELNRLIRMVDRIVVLNVRDFETQRLTGGSETDVNLEQVEQSVFNFADPSCDLSVWGALDDVVMGGVSEGSFFLRRSEAVDEASQYAVFAGNVSIDNSGGFASVRTRNFEPPFDFLGWTGMGLRVKGDGQRYKFILRNSGGWDSPAYIYSFDTVPNEWQAVFVPFEEMVPTFRARSVPDAPKLDLQKVFSFQLMLSKFEYDKRLNPSFKPGPFELAISDLSVYRPRKDVPLLVVSDEDPEIQQQQRSELDDLSFRYQLLEIEASASDEARVAAIAQALL